MLGHSLRRWPIIKTTQAHVFSGAELAVIPYVDYCLQVDAITSIAICTNLRPLRFTPISGASTHATLRACQGPCFRTCYDISYTSDWSRWQSRPIRSLRYIVTCTRIRAGKWSLRNFAANAIPRHAEILNYIARHGLSFLQSLLLNLGLNMNCVPTSNQHLNKLLV